MSTCLGCSCTRPAPSATGGSLLLATGVAHTVAAVRSAAREARFEVVDRGPGLLEVVAADPAAALAALRAELSSVEAAEVRALDPAGRTGDDLLGAALSAPTLSQVGARAEHADLLPLFADEVQAFRSVYQPIVTLVDDPTAAPVVGYEALLRATGPSGPVFPDQMFGAAADAGWLHVLDRVGRTTAIRGAGGWLGDRLLFVNFLPTTIYRPDVCLRTTEKAAELAGLALDQLVFEVTESERVTDLAHLEDVFAYYRDRGCRVALDDLGAGYSSLNMLVRLQPDIVKLDKDIVQRLPQTASSAVVSAVVEITHSYGGQVLAECVETAEQAAAARDLGVDLGQGWFFGRPEERTGSAPAPARAPAIARTAPARFSGNDAAVALPAPDEPAAARGPAAGTAGAQLPAALRGLADVEALLARSVDHSATGVAIADATALDTPLIYVNRAFEEVTGYRASEVLGRNCRLLQGTAADPAVVQGIREAVREGRDHVAVLRNVRKDGAQWWNELHLSPIRDTGGRVTHYFGFQHDVTARVEAEQRVAHLAYHDELTGLPNRRQLLRDLRREIARAERGGSHLALLFVDLDGFKHVNEQLGHAGGDLALIAASACLQTALRDGDVLARYHGDEFVALLPDVPPDLVRRVAQRTADAVIGSLHTPPPIEGRPLSLGASVGVAHFPKHGTTPDQLLQAADRAMHAAKRAGRGQAALATTADVT